MNTKHIIITTFLLVASASADTYQEDWDSLAKHEAAPEWFQDAKLGIYFHWGLYTVPAYGNEWYPRGMHMLGHSNHRHHLEKYGRPSEFGYHDFVSLFKAEHFDAEEWAELFQKAGAQFAGPVAVHHDGFAMWDSDVTPWNVVEKGPKRDTTGELEKAIKSKGMKFITTFHHARNLQRYEPRSSSESPERFHDSHYPPFTDMGTLSEEGDLPYLYGNLPEEQWLEEIWFGKLKEVVDQYKPDIIWFDSWLDSIPASYRKRFSAYYLNEAKKWSKEVVIIRKQNDLPLSYTIDDLEKSRKNRLEEGFWMADETLSTGSWSYVEGLQLKPAADILHILIDIVSKNGVLLLNVSPKSDGSIPENQRSTLLEIGSWLSEHGEAIYGTRPWFAYGEGPTIQPEGKFENRREFKKIKYKPEDIRYTTKGSIVYAITLGKPEGDLVTFATFADAEDVTTDSIESVSLLGYEGSLEWSLNEEGLSVLLPGQALNEMASVFKIEMR